MEYKDLVAVYLKLESTSKRLEKTAQISDLFKKTPKGDVERIILLLQGVVFHPWQDQKLGVAARLVIKAINISTGATLDAIEKSWKQTGDLGVTAHDLCSKKTQVTLFNQILSVEKVFSNLQKLATLQGSGTVDQKVKLISELLTSASPDEAKFIVRTVLEDLRVGIGEGTLRDAIVWGIGLSQVGLVVVYNPETNSKSYEVIDDSKLSSFTKYDSRKEDDYFHVEKEMTDLVQHAYDLCSDFSIVAMTAYNGLEALQSFSVELGRPIKVMLAQKVHSIKEGFEKVGLPCDVEYKYDGFRMQIHRFNDTVKLFTRNLEEVTQQFPDVIHAVKRHVKTDCILDAEVVGYDIKTGKYLPFQNISQRIRRKYDIHQMAQKFPVEINVFDVIYANGTLCIDLELQKRKSLLKELIDEKERIIVAAKSIVTDSVDDAQAFYQKSLDDGNEGVMLKSLDAKYQPGSRVGHMIKLKPVMDTLDLVIVGAEWGEGKRAKALTSFTLACIDDNGQFLEIGKVGTGFKELDGEEGITFVYMTQLLEKDIVREKGKEVTLTPKLVIEIEYEEIQRSSSYSSGYALRFPRVKLLREERKATDISTLEQVEELFYSQNK